MAFSNDPQAYWWLDLNIVESIRSRNVAAGNVIVVDILDGVKDAVQRGEQAWVTHAKHPLVVPPLASPMVAIIGQSSG